MDLNYKRSPGCRLSYFLINTNQPDADDVCLIADIIREIRGIKTTYNDESQQAS